MLKDTIEELKILLNMDNSKVGEFVGVGEWQMLLWSKEEKPPEKAERFNFLLDVVKEILALNAENDVRNILYNARVLVCDPEDEEFDGTITLAGYVQAFYNDYQLRTNYKAKVAEAVKDWNDYIESIK